MCERQGGAEIEVTTQMVEAGAEVLHESGEMHVDDLMVCQKLSQRVLQAAFEDTDALQSARKN